MTKKFIYVNAQGDYEESVSAYEASDFIAVSTGVSDKGKPVKLNDSGLLDASLYDAALRNHSTLNNLGNDDHPQYLLTDGTRALTGNFSAGGNRISNLAAPTNDNDAVNKNYVDSIATGLRPHGNVKAATTENIDISSYAGTHIDNVAITTNDRILVKDQTDAKENGIYVYNGSGLVRAEDFDNSPEGEIWNGAYIPLVLEGDTNASSAWVVSSRTASSNGLHQVGVDNIEFTKFSSPTTLTAGKAIHFDGNAIDVSISGTTPGLKIAADNKLAVNFQDAVSDHSTIAADGIYKAFDLGSSESGKGASMIGFHDPSGKFTSNNVQAAFIELYNKTPSKFLEFQIAVGAPVYEGTMVYLNSQGKVDALNIDTNQTPIGIVQNIDYGNNIAQITKPGDLVIISVGSFEPGKKYYWNNGWSDQMPTDAGKYVWMGGIGVDDDMLISNIRFIKRNAI